MKRVRAYCSLKELERVWRKSSKGSTTSDSMMAFFPELSTKFQWFRDFFTKSWSNKVTAQKFARSLLRKYFWIKGFGDIQKYFLRLETTPEFLLQRKRKFSFLKSLTTLQLLTVKLQKTVEFSFSFDNFALQLFAWSNKLLDDKESCLVPYNKLEQLNTRTFVV